MLKKSSVSDGGDANNGIGTSPEVDTEWASSSVGKELIIEEVTKRFPTHYRSRLRSIAMLSGGVKSVAILAN